MKKLLKLFSLGFVLSLLFAGFSSASSDCVRRNVGNNSICVAIDKGSSDRYTLDSDITCRDNSCAVSCSILLPDNTLNPVGMCDGRFYYDGNSTERVKLYITINNDFATIEGDYNFRNGTWGDIDDEGGSSSHSNDDVEISTDDRNPELSEYIDLIIETNDDYAGKIYLSAKYRSSTSNSWSDVSNTSSTYFSSTSSAWSNGYVTISSNGYKKISNAFKFAKKGYYRVYAEDKYGHTDYVEFSVEASSIYNDDLELSASTTNPNVGSFVRLTIDTDIDYVGNISFYKVQYKSSTSSSWITISSRNNSNYFSDYSDEWEDGYYKMRSSDNGHKVISNFLKFAKKGYYRIYAKDTEGNTDYIDFNVGTSSSDSIEISTNDRNPSTSEYVDLIVETDNDYNGKIYLSAKYRSSTSNSRYDISNTSSTYFSNRSSAWAEGYVTISSNGYKKISNAFKFAKKGYYRVYAEDKYGHTDYVEFSVEASSIYNDDLELSASTTNPNVGSFVRLTIDTDIDYVGNISFYKVQYKSSTSSSWITISSRNNSNYFSDYSDEWEDGYYKMRSSDNGHKVISNFLKFAKKGYYRIYAKDTEGNTDYIDFNVGSSSSNDSIEISTNDRNPSTSEYVDLIIETDNDYNGKIYLSAKYRSSTSNSRYDISNTSSTYFSNRSSAWAEGYTTISSNGYKKISDAFKFAKKGYYRIYAEDKYGNTDYIDFNVGTSSSSNSITLETNDDEPKAAEYVDLTVKTNSSYRGKVNFSAKYRSSTSNSWTNISRTSSTYFTNRSTTWNNGYITMTSSDSGRKIVENIFKFAKKGYYRIIAEDEDGYTTYLDLNVGYSNTSPLDGFTQKEFETIEKIYNVWPTLIRKLRAEYSKIRNSSTWQNMSDELYENMGDVVNKRSNRVFQDYDDFDRAFRRWFTYTQNLMY